MPVNRFKRALRERRQQIGLWCTLASPFVTELNAGAGFDWLLLDTEHTPTEPAEVLHLLQAAAAYPGSAVVRPAWNDPVLIKRVLDLGAQTLLIPYVQDAAQAAQAVKSMRYAPAGMRGVSGVTRATGFGRVGGYAQACEEELCLLVQVETLEAAAHVEEIAAVPGVDGVFVGPADLAASMGLVGQPGHPDVAAKVEELIRRITACGKPAGVLSGDEAFLRRMMAAGSLFTAVGVDAAILARETSALARRFGAAAAA